MQLDLRIRRVEVKSFLWVVILLILNCFLNCSLVVILWSTEIALSCFFLQGFLAALFPDGED